MPAHDVEPHEAPDRRGPGDRRTGDDRRVQEVEAPSELRLGEERRRSERRAGIERRVALDSAATQVHAALSLLTQVVDSGELDDDGRRLLDAAMLRLRYAVERMEADAE